MDIVPWQSSTPIARLDLDVSRVQVGVAQARDGIGRMAGTPPRQQCRSAPRRRGQMIPLRGDLRSSAYAREDCPHEWAEMLCHNGNCGTDSTVRVRCVYCNVRRDDWKADRVAVWQWTACALVAVAVIATLLVARGWL